MQTNDPRVLALGNFGFAEGAQRLAEKMHRGMVEHASAEDQAAAVTAAQALLRHAPKAIRTIVEIELIAEAVIRVWSDAELGLQLGEAARTRVIRQFSLARMADSHLELFKGLVDSA